jgi:hypothetical protein
MISDTLIQEYQRLCEDHFGVTLSYDEAHDEFMQLLDLVHYITPSLQDQEIQSYLGYDE